MTSANGQPQTEAGGGKPSRLLCGSLTGGGTITGCEGPLFGRGNLSEELGQRRISVELAARIAEALGVPIQALLPTERGGGSGQRGEQTISILTALLHYHESVEAAIAGEAPAAGPADEYAEALREAIRCVEEVHKA